VDEKDSPDVVGKEQSWGGVDVGEEDRGVADCEGKVDADNEDKADGGDKLVDLEG